MAHLIDKDALVAEIKERIKTYNKGYANGDDSRADALEVLLHDIDTLEMKEVNEVPANVILNKFGNKYISSWSGLKEYNNFQVNEEIKILIPNK